MVVEARVEDPVTVREVAVVEPVLELVETRLVTVALVAVRLVKKAEKAFRISANRLLTVALVMEAFSRVRLVPVALVKTRLVIVAFGIGEFGKVTEALDRSTTPLKVVVPFTTTGPSKVVVP
jgi:hypothetical protein